MLLIKRLIIILAVVLFFQADSCHAVSYPLTVKDCRGKTVKIAHEPKRIVALSPSNTEILFALGLGNKVVGVDTWSDYPAAASKKPKVGDRKTSVVKVISLKPDLVLAHGKLNDETIRTLEKHKLKVIAVDPKNIDQVISDIKFIGRVTNREKKAAQIANRIISAKESVSNKTKHIRKKPRVLISIQPDPLWTAGPNTFIDEILDICKARNIAYDAKPGFNQFSSEAAVWRNPEVIIGMTKGDKHAFGSGIWKNTAAAKSKRVYEVDPASLVRPGPRLAEGIIQIARLIHPDVFEKR